MKIFANTVRFIIKRPLSFLFFAIIMLAFFILDQYNPFFDVLIGLFTMGDTDPAEAYISILKLLLDKDNVIGIVPFIFAVAIVGSLLFAVYFSGFLYTVNNSIRGNNKIRGEFFEGFKRYFIRLFFIILVSIVLLALFLFFTCVALVPSVVVTKAFFSGKYEFLPIAFFVDLITGFVLFFALLFFRIYFSFWFAGALNSEKKAFIWGKRIADANFWGIAGRFLIYDVVLILFRVVSGYFSRGMDGYPLLLLNCLFYTIYLLSFIVFIFGAYKAFESKAKKKFA